jgi:hypothetical protein
MLTFFKISDLSEKAFAKVHGCYEALNRGTVDCAMKALTGVFFLSLKSMFIW